MRGRSRLGTAALLLGLLGAAFLVSPLSPHATTGVVVTPGSASSPIQVEVRDRGGRRTSDLGSGPDQDLAAQSVGTRIPVLTYPGGSVTYDDGRLRPTLWILTALLAAAGAALMARHARRAARP